MENFYRDLKRAMGISKAPNTSGMSDTAKQKQFASRLAAYKHVAAPSSQDEELKEMLAELIKKRKGK
jgi:hypothetical protein